jgi:hypothetical protein
MNIFRSKLSIEQQSEAVVLPLLEQRGWTFSEHYPARDERGDYAISRGTKSLNIELKAEQRTTGNLFIEEFSNYAPGEYAPDGTPRTKVGWFLTLKADYVIYHFLDTGKVYKLDLKELQASPELIYVWGRRKQCQACDDGQMNQTIGWCVPIEMLLSASIVEDLTEAQ